MAPTYDELKKKTVAELREIAKGLDHEAVQGYSQLNKEHLLVAVCKALGLDMHSHHHHEAGTTLAQMKKELKELKKKRDTALSAEDKAALKRTRTRMRRLKKRISRA
ncbi:MAG TPA: Rho termination factor N-terminal domain-containing protein [bacterium]|jgi:hypothetical protein|nr:Rho termination factor N-terminal domain-containing protein [bacterium]HOZ21121.1 Rho termination factor N-terminal domain-containing protein [bacterium]